MRLAFSLLFFFIRGPRRMFCWVGLNKASILAGKGIFAFSSSSDRQYQLERNNGHDLPLLPGPRKRSVPPPLAALAAFPIRYDTPFSRINKALYDEYKGIGESRRRDQKPFKDLPKCQQHSKPSKV